MIEADDIQNEFERDEHFIQFLRDFNPEWPEWWECEYSGNIEAMYAAYQAGKDQGKRGADGT